MILQICLMLDIHADLWAIVMFVLDHCNKLSVVIKQDTWIFKFPSAYESYVYSTLGSIDV